MDLKERYKVIATNLDWPKDAVVKWYDARGEYSENRIKELKIGFSMERMPSSYFKANAVFFRIGVLAYNLFRIFQLNILPKLHFDSKTSILAISEKQNAVKMGIMEDRTSIQGIKEPF